MKFHLLDVFGNSLYSGNQLAVFFDMGNLAPKEMQSIAREINFSETTFITATEKISGGYPVRIFTPASEIAFAGHPTLGTAYIIRKYIAGGIIESIVLNLKAGQIPVTFKDDTLWMKHNQPHFGEQPGIELLGGVLGLSDSDFDPRFPIREVSTGLPFTIVPLKSMDALQRAKVNLEKYNHFAEIMTAKGILIFCPEAHEIDHDLASRVFVNYLGIPEDPATGSGTGCLAAYLVKYGIFGKGTIEMTIGQGYEMGRPSELKIKAGIVNNEFEIYVGGKVFEVAAGEWKN